MKASKKYAVRVRVWVDEVNGPFLGIGRVLLLENIGKTGSITKAAKNLKMSYRQAWQLVEDMNHNAKEPLVEKILGGKGGGGARLTARGEKVIISFYALENRIREFVSNESKKTDF